MVYLIVIAVFFVIGLGIIAITRDVRYVVAVGDSANNASVKRLAIDLRAPEAVGVSPKIKRIQRQIRSCYRTARKKVKLNIDLYEFERWIYENYYHVLNKVDGKSYKTFAVLPHKFGRARIEIIAEYIVKSANCRISEQEIIKVINEFNSHTPLHYDELCALSLALRLALLGEIASVAKLSKRYLRSRVYAQSGVLTSSKYSSDESYLYWLKRFGKLDEHFDFLDKSDVNIDNIEQTFTATLIDNLCVARAGIEGLIKLKDILLVNTLLGMSYTNKILMADEVYAIMDTQSQIKYLEAVEELAIKYDVTERAVVDACHSIQAKSGEHFGKFLYERRVLKAELRGKVYGHVLPYSTTFKQALYIICVYGITTIAAVVFGLLCRNLWLGIAVGLLSWFALIKTVEFLVQRAHKTFLLQRMIPKLNHTVLPQELATLVVVPHYIGSEQDVRDAVDNIISLRASNAGDNIDFALLIDYKKSNKPIADEEAEWNALLDKELSQYTDIIYFIRRKIKTKTGYIGYERKRGAIMQLNNLLLTGDNSAFVKVSRELNRYEFVTVLDADSKIMPNTILSAVNTIAHPINRGYDLMAFNNAYNMYTMQSGYAKQFYYASGYESYGSYSDYYYNFVGKSIFCGKGIYRLRNFQSKLDGVLPEKRVLSHDIIEGAILNTGRLSEVVFEDAPISSMSDVARRNRWLRGDVQLLEFVGGTLTGPTQSKPNKKSIMPIYSHIMLSNVLKAFGECAAFALLMLALFTGNIGAIISIIAVMAVFPLLNVIDNLLAINKGVRYRYAIKGGLAAALNGIFALITLPFYALNNLFVILSTSIKLIFARNSELRWRTFSMSQQNNSAKGYFIMKLPSIIMLIIIAALGYNNPFVVGYTAITIAVMAAMFVVNSPSRKTVEIADSEREFLQTIARRTHNYFCAMQQDNALVTDNYQVRPYKGKAVSTSPTNIGFSLLAQISAYELKLIDLPHANAKITAILEELDTLEKNRGHLYNWYDINNKTVLEPRVISSVDSGNLAAALITTRQFLLANDLSGADIAARLVDDTDFELLFDKAKGLYHISYDADKDEFAGHYDLFASESRILYYITAAINKDASAWNKLMRDTVSTCGNTLQSWSGTMFEYLMPSIFFSGSEYSLIERTNRNVVKAQSRNKCNGLWGISESGYYKFDDALRYQYHAFGLSSLARRVSPDRCVISPYSSALALSYAPHKSIANLRAIKDSGGMGEYGFYEAIDYTLSRNVVYSYMAHHQGMVISSIANLLCDNAISRYFMSDARMTGAKLLLCQRQIISRSVKREKVDYIYDKAYNSADYEYEVRPSDDPEIAMLSNGKYNVVIDSNGIGYSYANGRYINKYRYDRGMYGLLSDFVREDGTKFSPIAGSKIGSRHTVNFGVDECVYVGENCKMQVYVPHCINGEVRRFSWLNATKFNEKITCNLYMDLCMSPYDDEVSHPVFNEMFISTEYLADTKTIIARRKSRDNSKDFYTAMTIVGASIEAVECNRYNFIGRNGTFNNRKPNEKLNSLGDVLYPCFGVTCSFNAHSNSYSELSAIIITADTKEEILNQLDALSEPKYAYYLQESAHVQSLSAVRKYDLSPDDLCKAREIARKLIYCGYNNCIIGADMQAIYGKIGLNSEVKSMYIELSDNADEVNKLIDINDYLNANGVKCSLIIGLADKLDEQTKSNYRNLINGTLAVVNAYDVDDALRSSLFIDFSSQSVTTVKKPVNCVEIDEFESNYSVNSHKTAINGGIYLQTGNGGYTASGYTVTSIPYLPYSNIISGDKGGTIITEHGGGYTYFANSREYKLTTWYNDPISDTPSERIWLLHKGKAIRINRLINGYVLHGNSTAFVNSIKGMNITVKAFMCDDGALKCYAITIDNPTAEDEIADLILDCDYAASWQASDSSIQYYRDEGVQCAYNISSRKKAYFGCLSEWSPRGVNSSRIANTLNIQEGGNAACAHVKVTANSAKTTYFVISADKNAIISTNTINIGSKAMAFDDSINDITKLSIKTSDKNMDALFNNLMRQVVMARLKGRCGYYQAGGAVGFRDQLQDCLALLYSDPSRVREHILSVAARQFPEGDVLHWWHEPNIGVRTKISDDKLFLPYVVAEYVRATADESILEEKVSYLKGELLQQNQESRYDCYQSSEFAEPLINHCKRAIESALKFGEHDLLLIGAGDWNDALNGIGLQGYGESVWLSMFCYNVINDFIALLPSGERLYYLNVAERLKKGIDGAYNGAWFMRAFTDDGVWLGSDGAYGCKIDLICQAFSIIANCADKDKARCAMKNAEDLLVDKNVGIIKLLTPPFKGDYYAGYISRYPSGVRENGGQYTHAAMWYIRAVALSGDYQKAYELIKMVNPVEKCADAHGNARYMGEPYVLAGDVYIDGRMGWSWYTGSAAWCYKVILEDIIGLRIECNHITITPHCISGLEEISIRYRYKSAVYNIEIQRGNSEKMTVNGVNYPPYKIPLFDKEAEYNVVVEY